MGLYAANVASSGQNFDVGQAFTAAGVGALAGALIGSGLGAAGGMSVAAAALTTSAGTGIAASGGGYMVANTVMGNDFQTQDFAVASIVGGASGALGPIYATTTTSAMAFGAVANVVQYEGTSIANTGSLSYDSSAILGTAVMGLAGGAMGGAYTPLDQLGKNTTGTLLFDTTTLPIMAGYNAKEIFTSASFRSNFSRTLLGGIISNSPDPIPD